MFKMAVDEGVEVARNYVPSDEFTPDKQMDLLAALTAGRGLGMLGSAATAPGGHFVVGPLREHARGVLEGLGGGFAGGAAGLGLEHLLRSQGLAIPEGGGALIGGMLGAGIGAGHGVYASRRNQREETGDYSTFGFNRDPSRQAVPVR